MFGKVESEPITMLPYGTLLKIIAATAPASCAFQIFLRIFMCMACVCMHKYTHAHTHRSFWYRHTHMYTHTNTHGMVVHTRYTATFLPVAPSEVSYAHSLDLCLCVYTYTYVCIYTYTHIHRLLICAYTHTNFKYIQGAYLYECTHKLT
jgi:hypothetical protein